MGRRRGRLGSEIKDIRCLLRNRDKRKFREVLWITSAQSRARDLQFFDLYSIERHLGLPIHLSERKRQLRNGHTQDHTILAPTVRVVIFTGGL